MTDRKPVHEAWADVMADLAGLAKRDRNTHQNFNFRGVDAVMNAVGPVLRAHRVAVFPVAVTYDREQVTTSKGSAMTSTVANVAYEIVGPDGSTMPAQAAGEAFDSGDKSMPKAMSVAYRTLLLQALCLPTDEADPDSHSYERAPGDLTKLRATIAAAKARDIEGDYDALQEWASESQQNADAAVAKLQRSIDAYDSDAEDAATQTGSRYVPPEVDA